MIVNEERGETLRLEVPPSLVISAGRDQSTPLVISVVIVNVERLEIAVELNLQST
jgi:hypothetical protein